MYFMKKWRLLLRVVLVALICWMFVVYYNVSLYHPSLMIVDMSSSKLYKNEISKEIGQNVELMLVNKNEISKEVTAQHLEIMPVNKNEISKEIVQNVELMPVDKNEKSEKSVQHLEFIPVNKNEINNDIVQHLELMPVDKNDTSRDVIRQQHEPIIERFNGSACDLWKSGQPLNTTHVINPDPFVNVIVPKTDCIADVYLVIYVHTSPGFHHRRDTIRRTWGNVSQYDVNIRLVFIVGEPVDDDGVERSSKDALKNEMVNYGDIVQSNFADTYRNLSHKAIAGLKWVTRHCRSAKYVLKTDDDVFVNVYLLLRILQTETNLAQGNVLMCNVCNVSLNQTEVSRSGKWKATEEECSSPVFPTFCQGIAFVMTMNVAVTLYDASKFVPLLWMDDVYLTGFLPALLPPKSVQHLNAETFYMSTWSIDATTSRKVLSEADAFKFIYYHEDDMTLIDTAWSNLKRVVQTQIFSNYSDALFRNDNHLERKRLKNVTCTPGNINNCYFKPPSSGPAGPPSAGPWGPVGRPGPWGPVGPPVGNALQSIVGFPGSPVSQERLKQWPVLELYRGQRRPGSPSY